MTRTLRGLALAALVLTSAPLLAQLQSLTTDGTTVADALKALRDSREQRRIAKLSGAIKPDIVSDDSTSDAFIIPVVGSLQGSNGTFFRSDVSLANRRSVPQALSIGFLQRGVNNGNNLVQKVTIGANTTTMDSDFVATVLNKPGQLGTLLVIAVTSTDPGAAVDTNASIDGFSRIWTPQPVLPGQSSSVGSVSQSFEAIDLQDNLATSYGYGLKQDANFRTNIGLVNLYSTPNTFTVFVNGLQGSTTFQQTVQPFSMEQPSVPAGTYGDMYIRITSDASNFNWWSAYGTTVDNRTGDGWVSHVH